MTSHSLRTLFEGPGIYFGDRLQKRLWCFQRSVLFFGDESEFWISSGDAKHVKISTLPARFQVLALTLADGACLRPPGAAIRAAVVN